MKNNNLKYLKQLLSENRESKNMSKARNLLYQQGYSQEDAQKTIEAIRNDIPNARLADCKFLLGVTRMYLNRELSDGNTIMKLNKTLKYVASDAHVNEYDNDLNGMSVNDLVQRFAGVQQQDADASRAESYSKQYTRNNAYNIVRIPNAETAAKYGKYTSWCVTHDEDMYNSYTNNGTGLFYFCLRNGFENEQPIAGKGCPLDSYGLSMIAVSVTMDGELNTCTCRWNHDNGGNDNIMDKNQLEELLGVNFYEVFKPYSREELHAKGVILFDEVQDLLDSGKKPEEIFYWCDDFSEGLGRVKLNGKYNYIDKENQILFPNQWFNWCGNFREGFGRVNLNDKWNYINREGQILSPNQWFDWCDDFSEGLGCVNLNDKWNYINNEGQILFPNQWFDYCDDFSEGLGRVKLNGEYYYINKEGVLCDYRTKEPLSNQSLNENLKNNSLKDLKQDLIKARKEVNTEPTEAQIKAENYKMGHIVINGFDITIENPKGSYRRGKDRNGKEWKTLMHYDYGYFKHTLGKDGDAIDVFIGPYLNSNKIFCVDQFIDGKFDETKVMLGFNNKESAKKGYLKNYEKDWKGFKEITEVSVEDFKKWLYDGHKQRKPFYKYSDIKNYYITESQFKYIKNKFINESDILTDIKNFYGGSTEHIENIRGYIFPDGEVVNVREKSHEDVRKINSSLGVMKVLDMGVIRLEYNGITLTKEPTFKQKYILKKIISNKPDKFFVDFYVNGKGLGFHTVYLNCNIKTADLICNHIIRFLNDGIKPNNPTICQNSLNENLELNWWEKCIEKYQKNGKIKLYHNTTKRKLEDILLSEELDVKMKHSEGHGDMLFFTVDPESWGNQCKISIEVPIDKFGNKYNDFNFVNNIDVIYRNNISIKDFNFKIEKVGGLNFNEIVDKIKNDDDKINQYLSWGQLHPPKGGCFSKG